MKIGIEAQRLFRKKKHGMEVVALELIKELQLLDESNEYVIYARSDEDNSCISERPNFKINEFKGSSYFTWEQFGLSKMIRKDKIDVLHSTCNTSTLFSNVPIILTLHDIIYLEQLDFKGTAYQNFGNIYRRFIVPLIVAKSEIIITVSNFERKTILEKFKLPEDKVKVIYNAVNKRFNVSYPNTEIERFRSAKSLPSEFILFLGNTAPKKNTSNVIKAYLAYVESIPNGLKLVILDYDRSLLLSILNELGKPHLIDNFIFPGYISLQEMPLLYNCSKIFLYPSLRESFGLPILEAMACGVPVITSNTSSMPEIAANAALLVDPLNFLDIKDKMLELLQDKVLLNSMRERGLDRAAAFTWKNSAIQLLEIYRSLKDIRK